MQTDFTAHRRDFWGVPTKPPGRKSSIAGNLTVVTEIDEGSPCELFSGSNFASWERRSLWKLNAFKTSTLAAIAFPTAPHPEARKTIGANKEPWQRDRVSLPYQSSCRYCLNLNGDLIPLRNNAVSPTSSAMVR
uniref:Uncharacterized protein n=1 Tax=Cladonia uncialis subsp. uncialis TaxID=180999 RepID=A0A1Z1C434_CLAUC|nr:hypothetical protein [Cladonia uncialis subsp. uncialis]AUW31077.1 hypothetical protein [Cladonia uncialis subsp. uncialis]